MGQSAAVPLLRPLRHAGRPDSRLQSPDARLIETEIGNQSRVETPAGRRGLPDDLLREAAHRLGILCLVIAGLMAVEFFLVQVVYPIPGALEDYELTVLEQWKPVFNLVGMAVILGSAGLFWYTRDRRR